MMVDAAGAAGMDTMGREEFLELLVTQLQNQDPLNPLEGHEFAAQLAEFSSLERLIQIGEAQQAQAHATEALANAMNSQAAMSAVGRTVTAPGNVLEHHEEGATPVSFELGEGGGRASLEIVDGSGEVAATVDLGSLAGGAHEYDLRELAPDLPPGRYEFEVRAVDAGGEAVSVRTFLTARIEGVRYGEQGPVFLAGGTEISFPDVVRITH